MGKRRRRQDELWVSTSDLPKSPGHPFYQALNRALESQGFDGFVEQQCRPFYAAVMGRPSLVPGRYFRLLLVGYFEGLDSERGIAWRAADSLAIRSFLGLALEEAGPDHSTISRTRRRIDVETHRAVFTWVLERLAGAGLVSGKTLGVDATTLEANAAMRSIVRRDTGESYQEFLTKLAKESGVKTPTRAALARLDRRRKKSTSNRDWTSPSDPDSRITKMKDGRTHLAHKAEHAVDLETGVIVAVTVQPADRGDTSSIEDTLQEAAEQIDLVAAKDDRGLVHPDAPAEVVADKGYHSDRTMVRLEDSGLRSYVSEPDRGRRHWGDEVDAQLAVYANRRRIRGTRGQALMRQRGELLERPFAHLYETGAMRRTHLRNHPNILKRLLVHVSAFNLGLLLRTWLGVGTPRGLQGRRRGVLAALLSALRAWLGATFGLDWSLGDRLAIITCWVTQPCPLPGASSPCPAGARA
jgi:transposase